MDGWKLTLGLCEELILGLSEGSNDSEGGDDGFALGVVVGGVDGR